MEYLLCFDFPAEDTDDCSFAEGVTPGAVRLRCGLSGELGFWEELAGPIGAVFIEVLLLS